MQKNIFHVGMTIKELLENYTPITIISTLVSVFNPQPSRLQPMHIMMWYDAAILLVQLNKKGHLIH